MRAVRVEGPALDASGSVESAGSVESPDGDSGVPVGPQRTRQAPTPRRAAGLVESAGLVSLLLAEDERLSGLSSPLTPQTPRRVGASGSVESAAARARRLCCLLKTTSVSVAY